MSDSICSRCHVEVAIETKDIPLSVPVGFSTVEFCEPCGTFRFTLCPACQVAFKSFVMQPDPACERRHPQPRSCP